MNRRSFFASILALPTILHSTPLTPSIGRPITAYYGGSAQVEWFPSNGEQALGRIHSRYDINSAYPYAMQRKYPG